MFAVLAVSLTGGAAVLLILFRRIGLVAGGFGLGTAAHYRDDFTQLSFDVSTRLGSLVRLLDGETSHVLGVWAAANGLLPKDGRPDDPILQTTVWGRRLPNPLGLAAGFDKSAECPEAMLELGFGLVEIGSVTPEPQPGNAKPRVFRLPEAGAVINRYGFNNDGMAVVKARLVALRERQRRAESKKEGESAACDASEDAVQGVRSRLLGGLVGVNLGKNKWTEDGAADFAIGARELSPLADYLVVNVSSPNTPGLRALQGKQELRAILEKVLEARDEACGPAGGATPAPSPPPLLLKIAPDLTHADLADVAAVSLEMGIDGIIVSNTTVERPPEVANLPHGMETGGLSGKPLFDMSTQVLGEVYRLTGGRIPLVGVGGVSSGTDAYAKIRHGASLVQLYTSFALQGPSVVPRTKHELAELLRRDGFTRVEDAVGLDAPLIGRGDAAATPPPATSPPRSKMRRIVFWRS